MEQEILKQELLENTKNTILFYAKREFEALITEFDTYEDLEEIADYLFNEGLERLGSSNEMIMKDLVWTLNQTFMSLIDLFKRDIDEKTSSDNISEQIGQIIRFINFIKFMQTEDPKSLISKELRNNLKDIKDFIFDNTASWRPSRELWSQEFKNMESITRKEKIGFETYYLSGVAEILRTISNKKRHRNAFPKEFKTKFNFYDDFHQIIGIYNLALYSFLEILEAWASIKPFIKKYKAELL